MRFVVNNIRVCGRSVRTSALWLACAIALLSGAAQARDGSNLLAFLRHHEAGGSYDRYYAKIKTAPPAPLTQMTVGEVLAWQRSLGRVTSTAAGGYQIIKGTLADLIARGAVSPSERFDASTQDKLARHLIADCAPAQAKGDVAFANCLAGIWAALPLVSGPKRGRSAYHGIAGNRARTSPESVLAVLQGMPFVPSRAYKAQQRAELAQTRFANGAVKLSRRELIDREIKRMQDDGSMGRSIVYTKDPYALN